MTDVTPICSMRIWKTIPVLLWNLKLDFLRKNLAETIFFSCVGRKASVAHVAVMRKLGQQGLLFSSVPNAVTGHL